MNRWMHGMLVFCTTAAAGACNAERTPPDARDTIVGTRGVDEPGYEDTTRDVALEPAPADREFVHGMLLEKRAAVEVAELAQQRAATSEVREFAARMVRDHRQAEAELNDVAAQAKVDTSDVTPRDPAIDARQQLGKLTGVEFDREYLRLVTDRHAQAIEDTRDRAERSDDPRLREWAARHLSILEEHLEQAQQVQKSLEAGSRT